MPEIKSVTTLRFFAAFYVLIFHLYIHIGFIVGGKHVMEHLNTFLRQGAAGMSLFFVLSGFVLAYNYALAPLSPGQFYLRRFARIYPVYVLAALVTIPWFWVFNETLPHTWDLAAFIVMVNVLGLQAWLLEFVGYWNAGASWSVSVELFFYALFPAILFLLRRSSTRQLILVMAGAYAFLAFMSLTAFIFPNNVAPFYTIPIYRLPEFVMGCCVGIGFVRGDLLLRHPRLWAGAATVAILTYFWFRAPTIVHAQHGFIIAPCFALIIWGLAGGSMDRIGRALLENRVIVLLGRSSYCLYLLQSVPLLTWFSYKEELVKLMPTPNDRGWFVLAILVAMLVTSVLVHVYFEEPCRRWISGRKWSKAQRNQQGPISSESERDAPDRPARDAAVPAR